MSQSNGKRYNVAIIGLGHRGYKTHFLSLHGSPSESVVAVCDVDKTRLDKFSSIHSDVPAYLSVEELLSKHEPDFALLCLPHRAYGPCIATLTRAGVPILREKPAAENIDEFNKLVQSPVKVAVAFQKRFEPRYHQLASLLPMLGRITSVRAVLARNFENVGTGWRALGIGVAEDLGVHMTDILVWLFGQPSSLYAQQADSVDSVHQCQEYQSSNVTDISLRWHEKSIIGNIHLSRIAHADTESVIITGSYGTAILDDRKVRLLDASGAEVVAVHDTSSKPMVMRRIVHGFGDYVTGVTESYPGSIETFLATVMTSEATKRSFNTGKREIISAPEQDEGHFPWPIITSDTEKAIVRQLHSPAAIYDRSNIIETFEDRWRKLHGLKHVLVCCSGTTAILHMFEALDLKPGDEILCPVYTFFATVTPMLQYGAVPVFCDSLEDGNLDPNEILQRSTPRTKAVIVTHMWGLPCRMAEIVKNAKSVNGGIRVLEDCSHAHLAVVDGKTVGTWGDMAAWSLAGNKNITGGHGGIFATNSSHYHAHAVTHGHFNSRAKQEVPHDHPLRKYCLTGLGLNLRAHPLAIAMVDAQLSDHPVAQKYRETWAKYMIQHLSDIPFLRMPAVANAKTDQHSWYAFVMQFNESRAPKGLTRDNFVEKLHGLGLEKVDIPGSTRLLCDLPLFVETAQAIPRFGNPGPWKRPQEPCEFPRALAFHNNSIKLPVWTRAKDENIVKMYVRGIQKVARELLVGNGHSAISAGL
ncbi:DegT/DnrJ/EryC1/StrS aminotransferase family-domain-containing protein [Annulohypoxylon moriforme]|nr:DegT/DnrJ/EryC1/StrS aminotransferase family-domain-containing protein [Annulohypoxylon moriforme]